MSLSSIFKKTYKILPGRIQGKLARYGYSFSAKSKVMPDKVPTSRKFPNKEQGGVIFTADFELAWAVRFSKRKIDLHEYSNLERANIPLVLDHSVKYQIPITWATVGHLFLDKCNTGDHDWMSRIPYFDDHWRFNKGDWFEHDPYSTWERDPDWYAPELIKMIMSSPVDHEISCHTFSHIDCSDKNCPPRVIDDELTACELVAEDYGVKFESMAFPGGTAGNFEVLNKHGIKIYRRRIKPYELGYPYRDEAGLLVSPTGPAVILPDRNWKFKDELSRYTRAIDRAIRYNTLVHLWFHPSATPGTFSELLPEIFSYCEGKRRKGLLWIGTMRDIQRYINTHKVV